MHSKTLNFYAYAVKYFYDMHLQNNIEKELERRLLEVLKGIAKDWKPDSFEKAKSKKTVTYQKLKEKEKRLNSVWLEVRRGSSSLEEFEIALKEWADSLKKIINSR